MEEGGDGAETERRGGRRKEGIQIFCRDHFFGGEGRGGSKVELLVGQHTAS